MIEGIPRFEIQDGFHIWIQFNTDSMGKSLNFPEITENNTIIIIRGIFTNFVAFSLPMGKWYDSNWEK